MAHMRLVHLYVYLARITFCVLRVLLESAADFDCGTPWTLYLAIYKYKQSALSPSSSLEVVELLE